MADIEHNFWRAFGSHGLQVLAIHRGAGEDDVRTFVRQFGVTFPVLVDPDGSVYRAYNGQRSPKVAPFPRDVVIGPDGRVLYYSRIYEPRVLRQAVEEALAAGVSTRLGGASPPRSFELTAYPTPFSRTTRIHYVLARNGLVRVRLVDVRGRTVAVLAEGYETAGPHTLTWNGRDASGRRVSPGVYICTIEAYGGLRSTKLVLLP